MWGTFNSAHVFQSDLSAWDVSKVTTLLYTFRRAREFNSDLSAWDVSKVISFTETFIDTNAFNEKLCWALPAGASTTNMFKDNHRNFITFAVVQNAHGAFSS